MNKEPETIQGKLIKVSMHKGLLLDGKEKWINIDNTIKEETHLEALKNLINKQVEIDLNSKGYWHELKKIETETEFSNADKLKTYTKIHAVQSNNLKGFVNCINEFSKNNKVKATQTHIKNSNYIAFIYYEVTK